MNILVSGSSGLIGSALVPFLAANGHGVTRLVRTTKAAESSIHWEPGVGIVDGTTLEGLDAVIHLAGESIASGRWNPKKKAAILESRVKGTRGLSEALARLVKPPKVMLCASAVGYYGNRGDEILQETSPPGSGFLADVCRQWEASTEAAARRGIRVVNLRIGIVLSSAGGALAKMLTPFRMGVGGKIGEGKQYMSWIAIDDLLAATVHALNHSALAGPVNAVAPNPVTNLEFTKTLGRVLRRPTIFPMPAFAARLAFGEMADELLLAGQRVVPSKLLATGFTFRDPDLEPALKRLLDRGRQ